MPHITIEHSFAIPKPQIDELLLSLNQNIAKNEGNFSISECKARAVLHNDFVVADGILRQDFVHITVRIMSGRNLEIRKNLAINLLKMVEEFLKKNHLSKNKISLSVDISEMEREIYQKTIL